MECLFLSVLSFQLTPYLFLITCKISPTDIHISPSLSLSLSLVASSFSTLSPLPQENTECQFLFLFSSYHPSPLCLCLITCKPPPTADIFIGGVHHTRGGVSGKCIPYLRVWSAQNTVSNMPVGIFPQCYRQVGTLPDFRVLWALIFPRELKGFSQVPVNFTPVFPGLSCWGAIFLHHCLSKSRREGPGLTQGIFGGGQFKGAEWGLWGPLFPSILLQASQAMLTASVSSGS